ncbi:hypothetical protein D3C86_2220740 [compost metagenome]
MSALINPPQMNVTVLPADAEVPAFSGNRLMALELAAGRVMVVPAVQISIGTRTVIGDRAKWLAR